MSLFKCAQSAPRSYGSSKAALSFIFGVVFWLCSADVKQKILDRMGMSQRDRFTFLYDEPTADVNSLPLTLRS